MQRNKVYFFKDKIIKVYSSKQNLKNELKFNEKFSKYFKVPEIYQINENSIEMERLENKLLKDEINKKRDFGVIKYFIEKLDYINNEDKSIAHGDLRLPHVFISKEKDFALIDFEYSNYGDINFDLAYFYFSLLKNKFKKESERLKDIIMKDYDYIKFLKSANCYCENMKNNSFVRDKKIWDDNIREINNDLKEFYSLNSNIFK